MRLRHTEDMWLDAITSGMRRHLRLLCLLEQHLVQLSSREVWSLSQQLTYPRGSILLACEGQVGGELWVGECFEIDHEDQLGTTLVTHL